MSEKQMESEVMSPIKLYSPTRRSAPLFHHSSQSTRECERMKDAITTKDFAERNRHRALRTRPARNLKHAS